MLTCTSFDSGASQVVSSQAWYSTVRVSVRGPGAAPSATSSGRNATARSMYSGTSTVLPGLLKSATGAGRGAGHWIRPTEATHSGRGSGSAIAVRMAKEAMDSGNTSCSALGQECQCGAWSSVTATTKRPPGATLVCEGTALTVTFSDGEAAGPGLPKPPNSDLWRANAPDPEGHSNEHNRAKTTAHKGNRRRYDMVGV